MREIQLTQGKIALVDDADYEHLAAHQWMAVRAKQARDNWYAKRTKAAKDGSTINIYMHRVILDAGQGDEVDHADDDGLNNIRSNIRLCSHSLNCAAKKLPMPASGYRGVYPEKHRYRAISSSNGKRVDLGYYDSAIAAALARDAAVYELFGEFAVLNFPRAAA